MTGDIKCSYLRRRHPKAIGWSLFGEKTVNRWVSQPSVWRVSQSCQAEAPDSASGELSSGCSLLHVWSRGCSVAANALGSRGQRESVSSLSPISQPCFLLVCPSNATWCPFLQTKKHALLRGLGDLFP